MKRAASLLVLSFALGALTPACGSGTGGALGTAGHSGAGGGAGSAGAAGGAAGAGTTGAAGAGTTGAAGVTGAAGSSTDAGSDKPATAEDGGATFPDSAPDGACGPARLDRVAPDFLLLLDRSGSMSLMLDGTDCPGAGMPCVTRWSECTKAVNQVVQETETSVRWGLKLFPTNNACGVQPGVAVPVGDRSAMAISSSILATQPGGRTPTRIAVASAADYLNALPDSNPKALLLATDGLPSCLPGAATPDLDDTMGTVAAVKTLADSGIPVYVIGIGTEVMNQQNLEMIAVAGGRPRAGSPAFYPVESGADLVDALRAIGAQSMPCTYALPFVPPIPANVAVNAANVRVPRDQAHLEGWDYDATLKSIRLYGTWCTKDQAGTLGDVALIPDCLSPIPP